MLPSRPRPRAGVAAFRKEDVAQDGEEPGATGWCLREGCPVGPSLEQGLLHQVVGAIRVAASDMAKARRCGNGGQQVLLHPATFITPSVLSRAVRPSWTSLAGVCGNVASSGSSSSRKRVGDRLVDGRRRRRSVLAGPSGPEVRYSTSTTCAMSVDASRPRQSSIRIILRLSVLRGVFWHHPERLAATCRNFSELVDVRLLPSPSRAGRPTLIHSN